jgi:hypothetical protein
MKMSEIFTAVKSLAENDTGISNNNITMWVDQAINRINQALQANIPVTTGKPITYEPEFDVRYHESLVLFSVGKYRESDSDYNSGVYFMNQFADMVRTMQRDMVLQPSVRTDYNIQQIIVENAGTLLYTLTMPYGSYFDVITVYNNNVLLDSMYYSINLNTKSITFKGISLVPNDKITIVFENNSDLNNPPYGWWSAF